MDLDVIRRIAERGLKMAQREYQSRYIDVFQHLLDELQRVEKYGRDTVV
jgi:hypothetical protein